MHYSFEVLVSPEHVASSPYVLPLHLSTGVLRDITVYFPNGTDYGIRCVFWAAGRQIAPTNIDGFYALDGDKVIASIKYDLTSEDNTIYFIGWNVGTQYDHYLTVHVTIQEPDELTWQQLQLVQTDMMNRLIDITKSLI